MIWRANEVRLNCAVIGTAVSIQNVTIVTLLTALELSVTAYAYGLA